MLELLNRNNGTPPSMNNDFYIARIYLYLSGKKIVK